MTPRRGDATLHVGRRDFLAAGAPVLLGVLTPWRLGARQDTLPGQGPAGKVWDPARAGRPMAPLTAADTDAGIQAIEKQLRCSCGCGLDIYTCRTTDFTCTYSPALHQDVLALAAGGKTAEEILDHFVGRFGVEVLMAPPKRGFNLAAYFVPSIAVLVAGALLFRALRRWTRIAAVTAAAAPPPSAAATPAELERLQRELKRLPG